MPFLNKITSAQVQQLAKSQNTLELPANIQESIPGMSQYLAQSMDASAVLQRAAAVGATLGSVGVPSCASWGTLGTVNDVHRSAPVFRIEDFRQRQAQNYAAAGAPASGGAVVLPRDATVTASASNSSMALLIGAVAVGVGGWWFFVR